MLFLNVVLAFIVVLCLSPIYANRLPICDLIASSDVVNHYSHWSCNELGIPNNDMCLWSGVTCVSGQISSIVLPPVLGIWLLSSIFNKIGTLCYFRYSSPDYRQLKYTIHINIKEFKFL